MLYAGGDNLFQIILGNKKSLDCKQTCDADNADDVADCIGVVNDNVSCDGKGKNLQCVCRSKVDKHTYKLKTDYDGKYVVKQVSGV